MVLPGGDSPGIHIDGQGEGPPVNQSIPGNGGAVPTLLANRLKIADDHVSDRLGE